MTDITLSKSESLLSIKSVLSRATKEQLAFIFSEKDEIEEMLKFDWMLPLFHQSGYDRGVSMEEAYAFSRIAGMIDKGELFMASFYINNWAYADKEKDNNHKNIADSIPAEISLKEKRNSDGWFHTTTPIKMRMVLNGDEEEDVLSDLAEEIEMPELSGYIEIGYQNVCKTLSMFEMGIPLLRVPYKINIIDTPFAAIFYRKNKDNEKKAKIDSGYLQAARRIVLQR